MPAPKEGRRLMNEALPESGPGLAAMQQQLQGAPNGDAPSLRAEGYKAYTERQKAQQNFYNSIRGGLDHVPQAPAPVVSAPVKKEEYLDREKQMNDEWDSRLAESKTTKGKARQKEFKEYRARIGL